MRRRFVAVVLVFSLVSCTTLRPVADANSYNSYLSSTRPSQVWVRTEKQTLMLESPRLLGDTLVGFVDGEYREFLPGEVRGVDVRKPASGRTALLVSGMVIVGAFLIGALASTGPMGTQPTPEDDPTNPQP